MTEEEKENLLYDYTDAMVEGLNNLKEGEH